MFQVQVDGRPYDEPHVDGAPQVYLIRNARLAPPWEPSDIWIRQPR